MNKENIFLKIITYAPLFFIPLIVGAVSYISINQYNDSFESNLEKMEHNLYNIEKQTVKTRVENLSENIIYQKSMIKKELIKRVKHRVDKANIIATAIYEENKNIKSIQEIKRDIKIALKSLKWNNNESYIWIVDYEGIMELGPTNIKHLEGSSIIDFKDATGRYVIKEEIEICKDKGEGYLWDTFTKPDEDTKTQYKQVAFVKSFGHFNWYFGSAEYLDTATKNTDERLLEAFKRIDKTHKDYTFIINTKGSILINNSIPQLNGKNISDIDNILVKSVINKIIDSMKNKNNTFISYEWLNPMSNNVEIKYSFVKKIPNSDWIIGSGFYLSEVNAKILEHKIDMYDIMYSKSNNILYISLVVIFISLLMAFYITKNLKDSFSQYKKSIDNQKDELKELNETLELKVETRTIELQEMKNNFEKLATTDTLTGIHNRYSLMKIFTTEINRSHRYNQPLSVMMIDIDFFKKVNDTYGHDLGDEVLIALTNLMGINLRDIDISGRYGGEEFLIILPNTIVEDAKNFAERLRREVSEHKFEIVGHLTVSIGLAQLSENEDFDKIFKRVDKLLYKSKNNGRDQVSY